MIRRMPSRRRSSPACSADQCASRRFHAPGVLRCSVTLGGVPVMLAWPLIDPSVWSGQTTVDRTDTPYLLWMAAIFFVGAIMPALVVPFLLRKRTMPAPQTHSQHEAVVYTVTITILVTVSTFFVLENPKWFGGAFLIAAILALAPIGNAQAIRPTLLRILGTVIGSGLVIAMVSQVDSLVAIYLIGVVMIVIALMARLGKYGWIYYVFMVPVTASLNATSLSQVGELGTQRVIDNVNGGALVLVASVLSIGYSHWASKHGRIPNVDPEASALAPSPAA